MAFTTVLFSVGMLIALSIPGYILRKTKLFKENSVKVLVVLLIYTAQPAMVAKSFLSLKFSTEIGLNLLIIVGLFMFVMLAVLCFAALFFRVKRRQAASVEGEEGSQPVSSAEDEKQRLYRFASMFGNTGYLGLPLINVLFPGESLMLLYTSLCIVGFNILTWTVGVVVLTGDKKYISVKKGLLNPVPIAALVTIPIFFIPQAVVPEQIVKFFDSLGSMTTPLSMIIMGARMAEIPFKEIFTDYKIYIVSFLRLIIAPLIALGMLQLCGITDKTLYNTLVVICMMPSAATTIVFAERFLSNSYTAIKAVLLSSVLCIATIPLLSLFVLV